MEFDDLFLLNDLEMTDLLAHNASGGMDDNFTADLLGKIVTLFS